MMNTFFAYNICLNKNIAGLNLGLHSQISQFSTMVVEKRDQRETWSWLTYEVQVRESVASEVLPSSETLSGPNFL